MSQAMDPGVALVGDPDRLDDARRDATITAQYRAHRAVYDGIEAQLDRVHEAVCEAPRLVAKTLLFMADTYAIISASTSVGVHELAFVEAVAEGTPAGIERALTETRARGDQSWAVVYHNNKARYIADNLESVDYDRHLDAFRAGEVDRLHRLKVDEVTGLGVNKAGFSLAMCGITEKMCVDTNVARFAGLDPDEDVPETVVIDRWEAFCADLREGIDTIVHEDGVSPYLWQWVAFNARRGTVETHDPWFLTVADATGREVLA